MSDRSHHILLLRETLEAAEALQRKKNKMVDKSILFVFLILVSVVSSEKSFPYAYVIERSGVDPRVAHGRLQRVVNDERFWNDRRNRPSVRSVLDDLADSIRSQRNPEAYSMMRSPPMRRGFTFMPRSPPPPPPRFRGGLGGFFGDARRVLPEEEPMEIDFEIPESGLNNLRRRFFKTLNTASPIRPAFVFGRRSRFQNDAAPILDMKNFVTDMTPEEGGIWLRNHTTGVMYTTIPVRGIDPMDIQVKISKGSKLIVSARRVDNEEKTIDGHGYKISEEDFHEEFPLPYKIDKNIRATVKNQVLKIELPSSASSDDDEDEDDGESYHQEARFEDFSNENNDDEHHDLEYEEYEVEEHQQDLDDKSKPFDSAEFKNKLAPSLRAKFYPSDSLPVFL